MRSAFAVGSGIFALGISFASGALAQAPSDGGHSTVRRHRVVADRELRENNDDHNILGVQGSLSLANQTTSGATIDSSNRVGMMWGAYYEHRFIPYFGLRFETNYNQRGFTAKDNQTGGTSTFAINYLEFGLNAKSQVKAAFVTPFVAFGPFLGVVVAKSQTANLPDGTSQQVSTLENTVNGVNFGLGFGGGIDFEVVRHFNLELGVRYSLGLTNVLTTAAQQALGAADGVSVHLNSLMFLGGAAITL